MVYGRAGWRAIVEMIDHDIADLVVEHHHFVGERDLVSHHMTMRGRHRASTMPLWSGALAQGQQVAWRFMHLWRVQDGQIVEHWACRDDLGLLAQVGLWHRPQTDETGDGR
ncbi:MAG: ester cyclase [Microbacterium sp.]|nr:MAG: ester cyclase [Microbacterium sp.]